VTDTRFLLVKGRAGLGNRMLSALTGILYSRLAGRRLIVDWSDRVYSNDGSNVFHRLFRCSGCDPADDIPETDSVMPAIWRGHLRESYRDLAMSHASLSKADLERRTSLDLAQLHHPETVAVMWGYAADVDPLRPRLAGSSGRTTWSILRETLRDDVHLQPELEARVDRARAMYLTRPTVGVHVRYTDRRVRLAAILRQVDRLVGMEPRLQIFLATDSRPVRDMFVARFPLVVSTPHRYSPSGSAIHRDPTAPDRLEHGIEAVVDLHLLADCDYLVGDTRSSFAYVASLLARTPESRTFDVRPAASVPPRLRSAVRAVVPEWLERRLSGTAAGR
jgi:hypothetical protein